MVGAYVHLIKKFPNNLVRVERGLAVLSINRIWNIELKVGSILEKCAAQAFALALALNQLVQE